MNKSELYLENIKKLTNSTTGISPYIYLSNLEDETSQDKVLVGILALCEMITMQDPKIDDYVSEVEFGIDFCVTKIKDLENIKNTFELNSYGGPLTRIGHSLDLITCQEELTEFTNMSLYMELAFNIGDLTEKLELYINILSMYMSKD